MRGSFQYMHDLTNIAETHFGACVCFSDCIAKWKRLNNITQKIRSNISKLSKVIKRKFKQKYTIIRFD